MRNVRLRHSLLKRFSDSRWAWSYFLGPVYNRTIMKAEDGLYEDLVELIESPDDMHLLDVGCGLGSSRSCSRGRTRPHSDAEFESLMALVRRSLSWYYSYHLAHLFARRAILSQSVAMDEVAGWAASAGFRDVVTEKIRGDMPAFSLYKK